MRAILENGGRIRVLVLDPTDDVLIETADRRISQTLANGRLRQRTMTTLDDLTTLRSRTTGRLEVRVSSRISSAGFNCLDVPGPRGLISVQQLARTRRPVFSDSFGPELDLAIENAADLFVTGMAATPSSTTITPSWKGC
ncbi:hypothetical protein OHS58_07525 [Amycolatopsis sp. NBC_00348]|uniref:hypothetical protein n=1 Tax=Amycolatopsis sp. NBC_00348 TaxID=2975956 RepID=UPI002E2722B7